MTLTLIALILALFTLRLVKVVISPLLILSFMMVVFLKELSCAFCKISFRVRLIARVEFEWKENEFQRIELPIIKFQAKYQLKVFDWLIEFQGIV